ncbi:MAG: hypothetical protein ACYCYI_05485 [Saccharofermentanales bacterium]
MAKINNKIEDDMKDLRMKSSGDGIRVRFNKNLMGGLKEKEVEEYITSLTQQFNYTEQTYKDRIDEFSTFTEMLTKERDEAAARIQKMNDDFKSTLDEIEALKAENERLSKAKDETKVHIEELISKDAERAQQEEIFLKISSENSNLKKELQEIHIIRDKLAGENVILKKQLKNIEQAITSLQSENNELKDNISTLRSYIRQSETKKSMTLSEYTEKHTYTMNLTSQKLKETINAIEDMKNDVNDLLKEMKDNKFIDSILHEDFRKIKTPPSKTKAPAELAADEVDGSGTGGDGAEKSDAPVLEFHAAYVMEEEGLIADDNTKEANITTK